MPTHKIKLVLTVLLILITCSLTSQNNNDSFVFSEIDSTLIINFNESTKDAFLSHHKNLRKSSKLSYTKGLLNSYKSLMWYHGYLRTKQEYGLDSAMHYSHLFETKIAAINSDKYDTVIGKYYMDKGTILSGIFELEEEGLSSFIKAYPYLDKRNIKNLTDYDISISRVYSHRKKYDKSLNILLSRLKDSAKIPKEQKLYLKQEIALIYSECNIPKKSLEFNLEILKERNRDSAKSKRIWWTKNEISRNYYQLGMQQKALDLALNVREKADHSNTRLIDNNSDLLSQIYEDIDLNKSISYLQDALKDNEMFYAYSDFFAEKFTKLASLYERNSDLRKAIVFYKKSNDIYDSIHLRKKKLLLTYTDLTTKYFKEKELNESILLNNQLLKIRNKKQRLQIIVTVFCFFMLLLTFILFYYYKEFRKGVRKVKKLKKSEKKLLEEQIQLRDNEIEATVIGFSERLSALNMIKKELEDEKISDKEKVRNTIDTIANLIDSASEISTITQKISSKYPSLAILLKERFPELTDREIDYCLLTKLNLSIKETASVLNVSPGTVKVTRSKLKSKMKIPQELSFKEYLNLISETVL